MNFGMNVLTVTLSGRVYDDQNNSGNDEGEPGFPPAWMSPSSVTASLTASPRTATAIGARQRAVGR
ncbi:MAG: hypothetical protein R3A10_16095 [Caldilineaceae bacterium]